MTEAPESVPTFDVFLSHNRKQKEWVRLLYAALKASGLEIFFDEVSIKPGRGILKEVLVGLETSRYLVFIVSPESVSSDWVGLEVATTTRRDLSGEHGRLIPVLLEGADYRDLPSVIQDRRGIDLRRPQECEHELRMLFLGLGVMPSRIDATLIRLLVDALHKGAHRNGLQVVDWSGVLSWGWNEDRLLTELIDLDYQTLDQLTPSDEGTVPQWASIFAQHTTSWRLLSSERLKVVGYWHAVALHPEDFQLAASGALVDSELSPQAMVDLSVAGTYSMYFVQICLQREYRNPAAFRLLVASFLDHLHDLSRDGVFVDQILANAYTSAGAGLCRSYGMKELRPHVARGTMYQGTIEAVLTRAAALAPRQLLERYRKAGLFNNDGIVGRSLPDVDAMAPR